MQNNRKLLSTLKMKKTFIGNLPIAVNTIG